MHNRNHSILTVNVGTKPKIYSQLAVFIEDFFHQLNKTHNELHNGRHRI